MSGTSSAGGRAEPHPNPLLAVLHYVLAYDVSLGAGGAPVQGRADDDPLPNEVVVAAIQRLRHRVNELPGA